MGDLIVGNVLAPLDAESEGAVVSEPCLVLGMQVDLDALFVIPVSPRRSKGRLYFVRPRLISLALALEQLAADTPKLNSHLFTPRPIASATPADLDAKFGTNYASEIEELRGLMIEPLVNGHIPQIQLFLGGDVLLAAIRARANELIADPEFIKRYLKKKRSEMRLQEDRLCDELLQRLYQYWAGGSIPGALAPFTNQCGGSGKRTKNFKKKPGRHNAKTADGAVGLEGFIVQPGSRDEKIIQFCYDHFLKEEKSVAAAHRRMCREFYSITVQDDSGRIEKKYPPEHLAPSRAQFTRIGQQGDPAKAPWRFHISTVKYQNNFRAILGSVKSDVYAVGQRGFIDSTSHEVQVVSADSRLRPIGTARFVVVADSTHGYISGFYMGLKDACSGVVKLTLYISMCPDELWALIEHLGLADRMTRDDWLPIKYQQIFCDNTDARTEDVIRSLHAIGTHFSYVPVGNAARNGLAEASHHKLHRLGGHQMRGSSRGHRKERLEPDPIDLGCHTFVEALRDFVIAVHEHNTLEIDVHVPDRFRERGVPPTRLALTRALMEESMSQRAIPVQLARFHLLPRYQGTVHADGARLHNPRSGKKTEFIKPLLYVTGNPAFVRLCEEARRNTRRDPNYFEREFAVNPYMLEKVHLVACGGPNGFELVDLELANARIQDPDLVEKYTLDDVLDLGHENCKTRADSRWRNDERLAGREAEKREGEENAVKEQQEELASAGPMSKTERRAGRGANREAEKDGQIEGVPILVSGVPSPVHSVAAKESPEQKEELAQSPAERAQVPLAPSLLQIAARDAAQGVVDDS